MASSEATGSETKQDEDAFIPFVIQKRPKHDVTSAKKAEKETVNIEVEKPNVALFENMELIEECTKIDDDDHEEIESEDDIILQCPSMRRMVAVLEYYNALMASSGSTEMNKKAREQFINFCDEHYGEQMMLEDYMHCIELHGDRESIAKMAAALKWKCSVGSKRCGGMSRHFRDRAAASEPLHFYEELMDTVHFNVLHLEDVGLRVTLDVDAESVQNEDSLVDEAFLNLSKVIRSKREQHFVDRLDDTQQNGKFSLCSDLETEIQIEGGHTAMDRLKEDTLKLCKEDLRKSTKRKKPKALNRFKEFFSKKQNDETVVSAVEIEKIETNMRNFERFQEDQHYDTETLHEDMKVFGEEGNSNVAEALKNDEKFFISIRRMLRYLKVSVSSFSTGKWFMYWPWYRTERGRKEVMNGNTWYDIDFGGHSVESLCVDPYFKNLEEEVLGSGLITKEDWLKILEKAVRLIKTSRCRKMKSNVSDDRFRYYIYNNSLVLIHHLCALLLYTDSSAFCTAMSETFRAIFSGETIEEINRRNSRFYWSSRYLRELVTYFGTWSEEESKPFWSGISFPLRIPQFQIGLIGPTSTTMAAEVALRFAGADGVLLMLDGGESRCFDATPFSCYPEEEERIFCGSTNREKLVSILMVETAKNYKAALSAFSKFDAVFSGNKVKHVEMSALDLEIIKESIRWIEGGEDAVNHKKLDLYILETFYSFLLHKKTLYLLLGLMHDVKKNEIINLVMNPLWNRREDKGRNKPKDANLMKPFVFNLFRHVHTVRIYAGYHPFDLLSFLRMLQSVDLPETLGLIIIEGYDWVQRAFDKIKEKNKPTNIEWEMVKQKALHLKL